MVVISKTAKRSHTYISKEPVVHSEVKSIVKEKQLKQLSISEIISNSGEDLRGKAFWTLDSERPKPGSYEITDLEKGTYVKVSAKRYDEISIRKKLLVHHYKENAWEAKYLVLSVGDHGLREIGDEYTVYVGTGRKYVGIVAFVIGTVKNKKVFAETRRDLDANNDLIV